MQSARVVTLKSGQQNAPRLTQNRQCTHLSFVQAQHYRDALESRAIRKLNHKSEMVRIRLRELEAFMRWVVVTLVENRKIASLTPIKLSSWRMRACSRVANSTCARSTTICG